MPVETNNQEANASSGLPNAPTVVYGIPGPLIYSSDVPTLQGDQKMSTAISGICALVCTFSYGLNEDLLYILRLLLFLGQLHFLF